jgi:hypothetical protein
MLYDSFHLKKLEDFWFLFQHEKGLEVAYQFLQQEKIYRLIENQQFFIIQSRTWSHRKFGERLTWRIAVKIAC